MGENFKLRWNDHHSIFFSTAEALCQGDHLTDVTLSCGKREFSAHKLVLSVCSTYFNELFTPKSNKNRPANGAAIVYLKDVDAHHMELLLNFMYRGEINVEEAELMDLIATARGLSIRGLSDSDEDSNEQEVKHTNENSSSRQIPSSHASPSSNNVPKSHQTSKAVKRSKSPSQPSTSSGAMPEISLEPSASKKIKQESAVVHHAVPEVIEAYDNDSGGGEEEEAEEFENPEAVYVEGQEDQYNLEEGEGEDGMMYDGELPHPEQQQAIAQNSVKTLMDEIICKSIMNEIIREVVHRHDQNQVNVADGPGSGSDMEIVDSDSETEVIDSDSEPDIIHIGNFTSNYSDYEENPLVCRHCSKLFDTELDLQRHRNEMSASLRGALMPNRDSSTSEDTEPEIVNMGSSGRNSRVDLVCGHCSKEFDTEHDLLQHKNVISADLLKGGFF